jgi:hypothetical protein
MKIQQNEHTNIISCHSPLQNTQSLMKNINGYLPTVSVNYLILDSRQPVDNYSKIRPVCRIFTPALLNQPASMSRAQAKRSQRNLQREKHQQ